MKTFLAIVLYVLSLFGIEVGSKIRIDHVQNNGTDVLYSKVVAEPTGTRFECLRSASGQCYYTVYPRGCVSTSGKSGTRCVPTPAEHFALAKGDTRQMASLPSLRMCVSAQAGIAGQECE